ncbi:Metallo-hydrolase/oxidoreductase [Penicillium riverlandense]|uniref:Metallo-hydrolase/oxidoreductase n=1 Tax=Penicillium riverlandense TaxID=1903569 RepID=UPI002547B712|nr:Metallo-hydrolase/oxidoreductase [Penicillium riverlandense]KAJ5818169.1 Metallo-hydrolase/oxidoreductase [Penicillium riverlandense]
MDPTQWIEIQSSMSNSYCNVWLMQAGSILIPEDFVLLPDPKSKNGSASEPPGQRKYVAPDFVFLIEHIQTGNFYLYDLGMRKDLHNLSPFTRKFDLPFYDCIPVLPSEILSKHGPSAFHPFKLHAIILSHLDFDHIGDCGKEAFPHAEIWMGPSACLKARPGYPEDPDSTGLSSDFPWDGTRKIVEFTIPDDVLESKGDARVDLMKEWKTRGYYTAIEQRIPINGWHPLGSFPLACDLFGDRSVYLIDSPGHGAGHQSLLIRVQAEPREKPSTTPDSAGLDLPLDDFVLLAGDTFHHPELLRNPLRMSRVPYSPSSVHANDDLAIDSIYRTREFAKRENCWVIAAHDSDIQASLAPGQNSVEGLVLLNNWKHKGWKGEQGKA